MAYLTPEQAASSYAFMADIYNPEHFDDFAISHLPQVELVKENMTSVKAIAKRGSDEAHPGKFLLCRVRDSHLVPDLAADFALEDLSSKGGIPLHFISPGVTIEKGEPVKMDLTEFFAARPVGSIVAIMHPWLTESKKVESRNPNHVVVLGKHHSLFDDAIAYQAGLPPRSKIAKLDSLEPKEAGRQYFAAKNYIMALECFKKALAMCEDDEARVKQYGNISITYLNMEKPEMALQVAEKGLEIGLKSPKLLYRKGRALFDLKRYSESAQFLKENETGFVEIEKELVDLMSSAQTACRESQRGEYDFAKMTEQAKRNLILSDHADYFDEERLEIRHIPEEGNQLFAKESIPEGTLIMASRALVFFPKVEKFTCQSCALKGHHDHAEGPEITVEPWKQITTICNAKFSMNPACFEEFKILGKFEEDKDEKKEGKGSDRFAYRESGEVEHICECNLFFSKDPNTKKNYSGIWIRPSLIERKRANTNCAKTCIGNFMFIRTSRDVKAGDPLVLPKDKAE